MKKSWEEPRIMAQRFEANEYVAACGDTGYGNYKFVCDAGGGAEGDVFVNGTNLTQDSWFWGKISYYACGTTHESPTTEVYMNGTFYYNNGNDRIIDELGNEYPSIPVIVWTDGGTDVHCTTNLNQNTWEITKS